MEFKDPLLGREFKDYRVTEKLGGGAFGAVYRAEHTRLSKSFAVKVLHPHIATNEDIVTRFRREAQSLAALDHPNIVQIIDFDQDPDIGFYLVLEWLKGEPLNKLLKREKALPFEQVAELFTQLLGALGEAHSQGIVHRDLKPANLMILPSGRGQVLKVLDFGIAAMADGNHDLTTDGTAMGSANYMSPEQALGKIREIDNRSDLYSCGIIFGKCLTGRNVFPADSPTQILWKHIYEEAPRLNDLYPEGLFPEMVEEVFARSIAKDKADRFQDAKEFSTAVYDALMELRQGMSAVARMPGGVTPHFTPAPLEGAPPEGGGVLQGILSGSTSSPAPAQTPPPMAAPSPAAMAPAARATTAPAAAPVGAPAVTPGARNTPAGLPAHGHARTPGRSSTELKAQSAPNGSASTGRFARFTTTGSTSGIGEGSGSGSTSGLSGRYNSASPGRHSTQSVRTAGGVASTTATAVGENSSSMSSSFSVQQALDSGPIRPKIRPSRQASTGRPMRSARRDNAPEEAKEVPSYYKWILLGVLTLLVGVLVWFFALRDNSISPGNQNTNTRKQKNNNEDNFWKNLEQDANKPRKRPGKRR
ncbi:MAG: serine/threonine protein kinase [Deltaproteobacteria bacterium]|nr:MAG: serine/threonine protein kinase [Deltaproteobacteria bacterium]